MSTANDGASQQTAESVPDAALSVDTPRRDAGPAEPRHVGGHLMLGLPQGWEWKESITVSSPAGDANVIASHEPLEPAMTTEEYADAQAEVLGNFNDYRQLRLEPMFLRGEKWVLREFSWHPEDGQPVRQLQIYSVRGKRGYTATATTTEAAAQAMRPLLIDTLLSLLVPDEPLTASADVVGQEAVEESAP